MPPVVLSVVLLDTQSIVIANSSGTKIILVERLLVGYWEPLANIPINSDNTATLLI